MNAFSAILPFKLLKLHLGYKMGLWLYKSLAGIPFGFTDNKHKNTKAVYDIKINYYIFLYFSKSVHIFLNQSIYFYIFLYFFLIILHLSMPRISCIFLLYSGKHGHWTNMAKFACSPELLFCLKASMLM